jgi:hypothetical protein
MIEADVPSTEEVVCRLAERARPTGGSHGLTTRGPAQCRGGAMKRPRRTVGTSAAKGIVKALSPGRPLAPDGQGRRRGCGALAGLVKCRFVWARRGGRQNSLLERAKEEQEMRRVTMLLAAVAVMVGLVAAVAYAAEIEGTRAGEILVESNLNDTIFGRGGADEIRANLFGPRNGDPADRDVANGNAGRDFIRVEDGDDLDTANGGKGIDACSGDVGDELNCDETTTSP